MHEKIIKILLILSIFIDFHCTTYEAGRIEGVKWNYNFEKIYYSQQYYIINSIHPIEQHALYYSNSDLTDIVAISKGRVEPRQIYPNPQKNSLIYLENNYPNEIMYIYNSDDKKVIFKKEFIVTPFPMYIGWTPNGDCLYFTDESGIQLYSDRGKYIKTLLRTTGYSGDLSFCLNCSTNCEFFIYTTNKESQKENKLYFFNTIDNTKKELASIDKGFFNYSSFIENNNKIIYGYYSEGYVFIYTINLSDFKSNLLYSTKNSVSNVKIINDKYIIFSEVEEYFKYHIYIITDKDLITKLNITEWEYPWDYNNKTNTIIYKQKNLNMFKEFKLPEVKNF